MRPRARVRIGCVLALALGWGTGAGAESAGVDDLQRAVLRGDVETVNRLIDELGTNAMAVAGSMGMQALHLAAARDRADVTALLLARGADVNGRTDAGFTPLHWAAARGAAQAGRILILAGADVNARAEGGITPLHWAASRNATNMVRLLLAADADVRLRSDEGYGPLHWAMLNDAGDCYRLLAFLQASVEVDADVPPVRAGTPAEAGLPDRAASDREMRAVDSAGRDPDPDPAPPVARLAELTARPFAGKTLVVPLGFKQTLTFVWIPKLEIWCGKFEITNAQFRRFRPGHQSGFREEFSLDGPEQPVVNVSWNDAVAFCAWLNDRFVDRIPMAFAYRLPTEAEWECIAACGDGRRYPWGDPWPPAYGNFSDRTARDKFPVWNGLEDYTDGFVVTCPVEKSGENEWGVGGLAGNAWEWCQDWYSDAQVYRVRRGASWDFDTEPATRVSARSFDRPDARYDTIGFRVVVAPGKPGSDSRPAAGASS